MTHKLKPMTLLPDCVKCGASRSTKRDSYAITNGDLCVTCKGKLRWRTHGEAFKEQNRAKLALQQMRRYDALRAEMVVAYGGVCAHCPEADPAVLAIDHINNDGRLCRSINGHGEKFMNNLKRENWPRDRVQLLCHNCNFRKEMKRRRDVLLAKIELNTNPGG